MVRTQDFDVHDAHMQDMHPEGQALRYLSSAAYVLRNINNHARRAMHLEGRAAALMQVKLPPPPLPSLSRAADPLRANTPTPAASVDPFAAMGGHGELHTLSTTPSPPAAPASSHVFLSFFPRRAAQITRSG
jgi:hypothetical protein